MIRKYKISIVTWMLAVCVCAAGFFAFLYQYDNKYITRAVVSQDGIVYLNSAEERQDGSGDDVEWLVEGWEFYPDERIKPGDYDADGTAVYIGQYFSFSQFHEDGSPYGKGTYRLLMQGSGQYTILLPEVFSACAVYIDGQLVASAGGISPYEPLIKDLVFSVSLDGTAELLIQTANYTHYYSGVTYPPAIGSSEAVVQLIMSRMLFYGFLAFTSLALALFVSAVWRGTKGSRVSGENFWLGILTISFSIRVCYPFIHMARIPYPELPYILENTMTALGLFCVIKTVSLICLKTGSAAERILTGTGAGFVCVSVVFSTIMGKYLPAFGPVYGQIYYWYKLLAAVAMLIVLLLNFRRNICSQILILFTGLLVYIVSLVCHGVCLGHYEPARFGWFEEWGSYVLILCFVVRMALRNIEIVRENQRLNEHLQEEVEQKTATLSRLLEERRMLLSAFAHDLKTPLTSIITFTRLVELDDMHLDDESRYYLDVIRKKTKEIQEQLSIIHEFTQEDSVPIKFSIIDFDKVVREFFEKNEPDVGANGIHFELLISGEGSGAVRGDERKLNCVLQNLVYNAVGFTPEGGTIRLVLRKEKKEIVLQVEDTGAGIAEKDIGHIFERFFTLRHNGQGMGLYFVKSIVNEHGGTIAVRSVVGKGTVFTLRLPAE